jgi:hypothetical protein
MGLKNKGSLKDNYRAGTLLIDMSSWHMNIKMDPLKFANSDELRKIQNRNRKNKRR